MEKKSNKKSSNKVSSGLELKNIIKDNICVVIKMSASWCGPCKNENFLNNYNKLKNNYVDESKVKFVELDIDNDSNIIEECEIDVSCVPTFFITKNGNFTKKFEGTEHLQTINKYLYESVKN